MTENIRPTPKDMFFQRMQKGEIPVERVMSEGLNSGAHDEGEQYMIDREDLGPVHRPPNGNINGLGANVWSYGDDKA